MTATPYVSLYDQRVAMVQSVIEKDGGLDSAAAQRVSVLVLQAIDHIPEKIR